MGVFEPKSQVMKCFAKLQYAHGPEGDLVFMKNEAANVFCVIIFSS